MFRSRASGAARDARDADALRDQLDEAYRTQTALLAKVRRGVADVSTSRKRVEVQLATLRQQIAALGEQAQQEVADGHDSAARDTLGRQVALEKAAAELGDRHATLKAEEDALIDSASAIERRIEDFRMRKDTLTARYSAAQARAEINSATGGIASAAGEIGQAMEQAERHTRELEATSDAVDELIADGIISRPGESADEALARRFDEALQEGTDHGPHQISQ